MAPRPPIFGHSNLFDAGAAVASNVLVNTSTSGVQYAASVVALADGGFLVSWDDANGAVRAQRFDALGDKIGAEFTVSNGVSSADTPEAALLAHGRIAYSLSDGAHPDVGVATSIWDPRTLEQNFDGINQSDLLWQHDSGQAAIWLLQDTTPPWVGRWGRLSARLGISRGRATSTPTAAAISSGRTIAARLRCG